MLHDYIERKMDDFAGTLAQVAELKNQARWLESAEIVGKSLRRLLGTNYGEFVKLTEIGILAGLVKNGPTVWVPYKMIMVIALLKEAGDIATVQYPPQGGHGWYLKALHLLLDALAYDELRQYSELVPNVEVLLSALADSSLPVRTRLLLMREYERRGDFRRVMDEFLGALEKSPDNSKLLDFGIAFFKRLGGESEATLAGGGLSHSVIDSILSRLSAEKTGLSSPGYT